MSNSQRLAIMSSSMLYTAYQAYSQGDLNSSLLLLASVAGGFAGSVGMQKVIERMGAAPQQVVPPRASR